MFIAIETSVCSLPPRRRSHPRGTHKSVSYCHLLWMEVPLYSMDTLGFSLWMAMSISAKYRLQNKSGIRGMFLRQSSSSKHLLMSSERRGGHVWPHGSLAGPKGGPICSPKSGGTLCHSYRVQMSQKKDIGSTI